MAQLLDHRGLPINTAALKNPPAGPAITRMRSPYAAQIGELTPEFIASALRQCEWGQMPERYLALAESMEERDMHYRSVLGTRKMALSGREIIVEAASNRREDRKIADFIRSVVTADEFADIVSDQQDALGKGFSAGLIRWDTSEKEWRPLDIEWQDPRWFGFPPLSSPYYPMLRDGADFLPLTAWAYVVHIPKLKSGLPLRGGLARAAAWAFMAKNFTLKDWLAFSEVFGMPLRLGKYPLGTDVADIDILAEAVAALGSDAAAVIPDVMAVELKESAAKAASAAVFKELAEYLDKQVSKAVLGQTETADATPGRLGAASEKEEVRQDILRFDARQNMVSNKRDLITPLVRLNFGPDVAMPTVRFDLPESDERELLIEAIKVFVPLGWKVDGAWLRDKFGVPDPDDATGEVEWLGASQPAAPVDTPQQQANLAQQSMRSATCPHCAASAHAQGNATAYGPPDVYAGQLADRAADAHKAMLDVIRQAAEDAEDLEALRDRLLHLYGDLPVDNLREVMSAGFALATLAGRYKVKEEV